MEKTQLRIDNIVAFEATAHIVNELHGDKVLHTWLKGPDRHWDGYDAIEGFPLTEEWLKKFGFLENDADEFSDKTSSLIILRDKGEFFKYDICADPHYNSIGILVQHIHQLQNLYFALTGEELKLID